MATIAESEREATSSPQTCKKCLRPIASKDRSRVESNGKPFNYHQVTNCDKEKVPLDSKVQRCGRKHLCPVDPWRESFVPAYGAFASTFQLFENIRESNPNAWRRRKSAVDELKALTRDRRPTDNRSLNYHHSRKQHKDIEPHHFRSLSCGRRHEMPTRPWNASNQPKFSARNSTNKLFENIIEGKNTTVENRRVRALRGRLSSFCMCSQLQEDSQFDQNENTPIEESQSENRRLEVAEMNKRLQAAKVSQSTKAPAQKPRPIDDKKSRDQKSRKNAKEPEPALLCGGLKDIPAVRTWEAFRATLEQKTTEMDKRAQDELLDKSSCTRSGVQENTHNEQFELKEKSHDGRSELTDSSSDGRSELEFKSSEGRSELEDKLSDGPSELQVTCSDGLSELEEDFSNVHSEVGRSLRSLAG